MRRGGGAPEGPGWLWRLWGGRGGRRAGGRARGAPAGGWGGARGRGRPDPPLGGACAGRAAVPFCPFAPPGSLSAAPRPPRRYLPPAAIYVAYNIGIIATLLA